MRKLAQWTEELFSKHQDSSSSLYHASKKLGQAAYTCNPMGTDRRLLVKKKKGKFLSCERFCFKVKENSIALKVLLWSLHTLCTQKALELGWRAWLWGGVIS